MNVVKKENMAIVIRTYTDQSGQEKKVFKTIGEITTFQGEKGTFQSAEIYTIPGARISIFSQEKREALKTSQKSEEQQPISSIPF